MRYSFIPHPIMHMMCPKQLADTLFRGVIPHSREPMSYFPIYVPSDIEES